MCVLCNNISKNIAECIRNLMRVICYFIIVLQICQNVLFTITFLNHCSDNFHVFRVALI